MHRMGKSRDLMYTRLALVVLGTENVLRLKVSGSGYRMNRACGLVALRNELADYRRVFIGKKKKTVS